MNCANHADASAVAYCRTCGKALCNNCTRPVRGVIYCEDCLGARMEGTIPPLPPLPPVPPIPPAPPSVAAGFAGPGAIPNAPPPGAIPNPPGTGSGPNPALAGILGAIPFGVGAVYNGQYAKGLAHLIIFFLLVSGVSSSGHGTETLQTLCGIGIAAFVIYQIIDAVRSAQAIRAGLPPPDPFGLGQAFTTGEKIDTRKVPTGAIVLIVLGGLFLASTSGLFDLNFHRLWPIALILIGLWIFATRWGIIGNPTGCSCEMCRAQCLMGPAILVTLGVVGLIGSFREVGFFTYVGAVLLVIGGVKLFQGGASSAGHRQTLSSADHPAEMQSPPMQSPPPASGEVNRG